MASPWYRDKHFGFLPFLWIAVNRDEFRYFGSKLPKHCLTHHLKAPSYTIHSFTSVSASLFPLFSACNQAIAHLIAHLLPVHSYSVRSACNAIDFHMILSNPQRSQLCKSDWIAVCWRPSRFPRCILKISYPGHIQSARCLHTIPCLMLSNHLFSKSPVFWSVG